MKPEFLKDTPIKQYPPMKIHSYVEGRVYFSIDVYEGDGDHPCTEEFSVSNDKEFVFYTKLLKTISLNNHETDADGFIKETMLETGIVLDVDEDWFIDNIGFQEHTDIYRTVDSFESFYIEGSNKIVIKVED